MLIASARISPRTAKRYEQFAAVFRSAISNIVVAAQSRVDADRFAALGVRDVRVTGNIKFDIEIAPSVRDAGNALRNQLGDRFVWVAGSTHAGEELAALDAHQQVIQHRSQAVLVLTPRHPQRFADVKKILSDRRVNFVTRSSGTGIGNATVLLVDTMGELLHFYAAADLAFVGGTLVPIGGHNLLEPIALGVATVCGPYTSNTQEVADLLLQDQALLQVNANDFKDQIVALATNREQRNALASNGLRAIQENRGALARALELVRFIEPLR